MAPERDQRKAAVAEGGEHTLPTAADRRRALDLPPSTADRTARIDATAPIHPRCVQGHSGYVTTPAENVLVLSEPDYAFGAGDIRLRVEQVDRAHSVIHHGDIWYQVQGMQLNTGGAEIGRREVLVRGRRLPPPG